MLKLNLLRMTFLSLIIAGCFSFNALAVVESYQFDSDQDRKRYHQFIDELRCPKCQNQNLAGSNSPIAADLRKQLHRLITEQANDAQVVDFMVSRYGDFVLYDPPFNKKTMVLWLGPCVLLIFGLLFALSVIRRSKPSSDDTAVDAQALANIKRQLNDDDDNA